MKSFKYILVTFALAAATLPTKVGAQDEPCQSQAAAAEAAGAAAAPVDEAYGQTLEQLATLTGPLATEAPELIAAQTDLISQLSNIQQAALLQGAGVSTGDSASAAAAAAAASALINADIAQLQAGLVGSDGQQRANVIQAANLALQAKDQAQAVSTANQNVLTAVQALTACAEAAAGAAGGGGSDGGGDSGSGGE